VDSYGLATGLFDTQRIPTHTCDTICMFPSSRGEVMHRLAAITVVVILGLLGAGAYSICIRIICRGLSVHRFLDSRFRKPKAR
jgi:hypothetical protein